jgi:hypothetical protein
MVIRKGSTLSLTNEYIILGGRDMEHRVLFILHGCEGMYKKRRKV